MITDKNSCFSLKRIFEVFPSERSAEIYNYLRNPPSDSSSKPQHQSKSIYGGGQSRKGGGGVHQDFPGRKGSYRDSGNHSQSQNQSDLGNLGIKKLRQLFQSKTSVPVIKSYLTSTISPQKNFREKNFEFQENDNYGANGKIQRRKGRSREVWRKRNWSQTDTTISSRASRNLSLF